MKKMLIVDDDEAVRKMMAQWFRDEDFSVDVAKDAQEALSEFDMGEYNIILTDTNMPGMTGPQLIEIIRSTHPIARIVLMSGNPEPLHRADEFYQKGGDLNDLSDIVDSLIR